MFLHGNGGRGSQWAPQLAALAGTHRAAALDLRGMGRSDPPRDSDFSVGALADDVAAAADGLGFARFVLVGHSLGASVAACCAGRFPERLLGLVLVDFGGDLRDDGPEALANLVDGLRPDRFAGFAHRAVATCLRGARPAVAVRVLADLAATPPASFAGAALGLVDFDAAAALGGYDGPALHLYSPFLETLGLVPIHHRVPCLPAQRLDDTSHWLHLDRPGAFHRRLLSFLRSLDP